MAWVGLGSNVGRRPARLRAGLERLRARGLAMEAVSSLYLTEPVLSEPRPSPADTGPWYVNCVARVRVRRSRHDPGTLLEMLLDVEREAGRDRPDPSARSTGQDPTAGREGRPPAVPEPRTLDLDLLLFGDAVVDRPGLRVPHPRMHQRRFVLEPLCELDPGLRHPAADRTMASLLDKLPGQDGVWLLAPPPAVG